MCVKVVKFFLWHLHFEGLACVSGEVCRLVVVSFLKELVKIMARVKLVNSVELAREKLDCGEVIILRKVNLKTRLPLI